MATDAQIKKQTRAQIAEFMQAINAHYGRTLDTPRATFGITRPGLLGTGGGKLKVSFMHAQLGAEGGISYMPGSAKVAFNLRGLREFPEIARATIGHEVAHAVEVQLYPAMARAEGHGPAWREVMAVLGLPPVQHATHESAKIADAVFTCGCPGKTFGLTARRAVNAHRLSCRVCGKGLQPAVQS